MNTRSNILVGIVSVLAFHLLAAQDSKIDTCMAAAEKLAAVKEYPAAIRTLQTHLAGQPADQAASRLLARIYYWSGDTKSADTTYNRLLSGNPDDAVTRIEFGRFLLETGQYNRTEELIQPLAAAGNAEARTILGTSAYWQGDWTLAANIYRQVLSLQPDQQEARQRLLEIRWASAPKVTLSPEYQSDNQPIRRTGAKLAASFHITPLMPLTLTAGSSRINAANTLLAFRHVNLKLANTWGKSGVTLEGEAGLSSLDSRAGSVVDYRAALAMRLGGSSLLTASIDHAPYYETTSSFSTEVTTTAWGLTLERSAQRSWIGKASFQRKRYFDGNSGLQVYGWFLTSPGTSKGATVQVGYGFSYQDTDEDHYVQATNGTAVYAPYYTPHEQATHSALLLLNVPFSPSVSLTANGSYGVFASELAPTLSRVMPAGPSAGVTFVRRSFSPWQARISLDAALSSSLHVLIGISRQESAYYQVSLVSAEFSYTFLPEIDQP